MMTTQNPSRSEVRIAVREGPDLEGLLSIPQPALGIVVLLRGDERPDAGSERGIAEALHAEGLATLLIASFEADESSPRHGGPYSPGVGIEKLASRLVTVMEWLLQNPETQPLNIGYFASRTGAAAALIAAARAPAYIDAIVLLAGRLELAGDELRKVRAPTLLMSDGAPPEHDLQAFQQLRTDKSMQSVGPTGRDIVELSSRWFVRHLKAGTHSIPA
jgi:putative phosphoribosyl transferase